MKEFCARVKAAVPADELLFGFSTDAHCEEGPEPTGYGAGSLAHLEHFGEAGKRCGAEFLIDGGDMTNGHRPKAQSVREIRQAANAVRNGGGIPAYFAFGNHDDNTYYCRENPDSVREAISGTEWQRLVYADGMPPGAVCAPETSNCFYFDLPEHRIRCLMLNTVDLPLEIQSDGTLKYYTIDDHGFSKAQLEFVASMALDFSYLPEPEQWGLLLFSHMSLDFVLNGELMAGILGAFQNGVKYRSQDLPGIPTELWYDVRAGFTGQGKREIIAHIYGHEHIDDIRRNRGFAELSMLSSLCHRNKPEAPERIHGTSSAEAWSMIALDRKSRLLRVFRYGAGKDFSVRY